MVAEAVAHLLPGEGRREYAADERAGIEDVLDGAVEWQAGRLPLGEFWRIGSVLPRPWTYRGETCRGTDAAGYSRFVSLVWATRANDPRRAALAAAIEAARRAGMIRPRPEGR